MLPLSDAGKWVMRSASPTILAELHGNVVRPVAPVFFCVLPFSDGGRIQFAGDGFAYPYLSATACLWPRPCFAQPSLLGKERRQRC